VRGIETQIVDPERDRLGSQVSANGVEELRERMTATLGIALRPQVREELVARDAPISRRREECQKGEAQAQGRTTRKRPVFALENDATERSEPIHRPDLTVA
jgi:hypothetical protein